MCWGCEALPGAEAGRGPQVEPQVGLLHILTAGLLAVYVYDAGQVCCCDALPRSEAGGGPQVEPQVGLRLTV
jgi:hypothetical protein